jgi:TonB family protein
MSDGRDIALAVALSLSLHAGVAAGFRMLGRGPADAEMLPPLVVHLLEPVVARHGTAPEPPRPAASRSASGAAARTPPARPRPRPMARPTPSGSRPLASAPPAPAPTPPDPAPERAGPAPPVEPPPPPAPPAGAEPRPSEAPAPAAEPDPAASRVAAAPPPAAAALPAPPAAPVPRAEQGSAGGAGAEGSGTSRPAPEPGSTDERTAAAASPAAPSVDPRASGGLGPPVGDAVGQPGADGAALSDERLAIPPEYDAYVRALRRRIQERLTYPWAAVRRGLAGTVDLEVRIDGRGRLAGVSALDGRAPAILRDAATRAVADAAPFPFPPGLAARELTVRLPIVFELR